MVGDRKLLKHRSLWKIRSNRDIWCEYKSKKSNFKKASPWTSQIKTLKIMQIEKPREGHFAAEACLVMYAKPVSAMTKSNRSGSPNLNFLSPIFALYLCV